MTNNKISVDDLRLLGHIERLSLFEKKCPDEYKRVENLFRSNIGVKVTSYVLGIKFYIIQLLFESLRFKVKFDKIIEVEGVIKLCKSAPYYSNEDEYAKMLKPINSTPNIYLKPDFTDPTIREFGMNKSIISDYAK